MDHDRASDGVFRRETEEEAAEGREGVRCCVRVCVALGSNYDGGRIIQKMPIYSKNDRTDPKPFYVGKRGREEEEEDHRQ